MTEKRPGRYAHVFRAGAGWFALHVYQGGQLIDRQLHRTRAAAMFAGVAALFGQVVADA